MRIPHKPITLIIALILACSSASGVNYTLSEIAKMCFTNANMALFKLDSLKRSNDARGWGDISQSYYEAVAAIIYYYVDEPFDGISHAARCIASPDTSQHDIYCKLVCCRILADFNDWGKDWEHYNKTLDKFDSLMTKYKKENLIFAHFSHNRRLKIEALRDDSEAAIKDLNQFCNNLLAEYNRSGARDIFIAYMEGLESLADIYKRQGKINQEETTLNTLLAEMEKAKVVRDAKPSDTNFPRYEMARINANLRLSIINMEQGEDPGEPFKKAMALNSKYRSLPKQKTTSADIINSLSESIANNQITLVRQNSLIKTMRLKNILMVFFILALLATSAVLFKLYRNKIKENEILVNLAEEDRKNTEFINALIKPGEDEVDAQGRTLLSKVHEAMLTDNAYLKHDFDIDETFRKLGTNRRTVNSALKSTLGVGVAEYLRNLRLGRALTLLEKSDETLDAIAEECGFNSTRTFLRAFKERYNITPTRFRQKGLGGGEK